MEGFNFFYGLNQNLFPKTNQCEETNGHGDLYCFFHTNKDLDLVVLLLFYAILGEKITKKTISFMSFLLISYFQCSHLCSLFPFFSGMPKMTTLTNPPQRTKEEKKPNPNSILMFSNDKS